MGALRLALIGKSPRSMAAVRAADVLGEVGDGGEAGGLGHGGRVKDKG